MSKLVGVIASMCALVPFSYAVENPGNKTEETTTSAAQSPSTIGDGARQVGREVKATGCKVRRAVVTRSADGRHTVKGRAECASHGGVSAQN